MNTDKVFAAREKQLSKRPPGYGEEEI